MEDSGGESEVSAWDLLRTFMLRCCILLAYPLLLYVLLVVYQVLLAELDPWLFASFVLHRVVSCHGTTYRYDTRQRPAYLGVRLMTNVLRETYVVITFFLY